MIGKVIKNNYKIMDEIGRGSVATIYLAKDMTHNQVVALKIIHPEQAAEGQFLQRFQREAKLLQMLSSPQAVKVFDYGEEEGLNFIVLEYVQGRTLTSILEEEGPLEVNRTLDIAKQVALCLVDAHAKSIVHRDIRPANFMVTAEGTVKVMDFGVAWGAELSRLTATGVLGTPHYLSPEQVQGKTVDGRSDIYSLGVTLFEMLSGRKPYDADSTADILLALLHEPMPSLHQLDEGIPLEVDELVRKCLAKAPEDRYQSAAEFLEAIDETLRTIARRKEGVAMGVEAGLVGQTLGAYRIIEQVGRGGMATVYKAYEPALDRYVAIKVLPQYFAHDPDFTARFEREAKAVAKLNHPNILPIYSFGEEAGLNYIAMRYVEAGTLKEMLGPLLDLKTTADIVGQIGRALDYAHRQGVVHRDVKPTNVLMAEGEWALLTDFGLARMVESSMHLTKSGVGVGTPAYMSPEQGQGIRVDARSDVYSLGVVLYEMVTGKVPYEAETPMAIVIKHITAPLPLPREANPDLPEAVERVILKAMAKAPEGRYQTAGEMVEALEKAVAGVPVVEVPPEVKPVPVVEVPSTVVAEPTPTPAVAVPVEGPPVAKKGLPGWLWGVVGALVLLIAAGGVFLATRGEKPPPTPEATAALAATPIPGIGADLWVYDDFNNPDNEGRYDEGLWELRAAQDQVAQRDGAMVFTQQGKPHEGAELTAHKYHEISLDRPTFFEARLMLSPDTNAGDVHLDLRTELAPNEVWYANCNIGNQEGEAMAGCFNEAIHHGQVESTHGSEPVPTQLGSWHTLRMEVDPNTMTFNYFVDGQSVGSHIPPDADRLKQARFTLSIGIYTPSADALTGYVDDVRVGPLEAPITAPVPPSPLAPVSPGVPPMDAREVRPCAWEGLGPGLCITPFGGGAPTKILEDTELDIAGPPSWSPDGQQIAFSALEPGESPDRDTTIYIVNADGTGLTELPSVGNDINPAWSPDGQWLTFHSSGSLALMRPDGSDLAWVWYSEGRECASDAQWSPDSKWIAVFMQIGGCEWTFPMRRELWVISRDGATVTTVATLTHQDDSCVWPEVAFSPDGRQVAYFDADCQPRLVNADGSGQAVPLTDFPGWWRSTVYPQWGVEKEAPLPKPVSPGVPPMGAREVRPCDWEGLGPGLCIFPVEGEGGAPTKILEDAGLEIMWSSSWSPDGQQIAFSAIKPGEDPGRDATIYIVNADGSGLTELPSVGNDVSPAWSPDGEWLTFHSSGNLAIMRTDGSDSAVIWDGEGRACVQDPQWSPDSQWIAVPVQIGGCEWTFPMTREVWVISRDGATVTTVAAITHENDSCLHGVAFSPDGRQVAYMDADCRPWIVNADGSGQTAPLDDFPYWWTSAAYPQWGGERKAPPATAPPVAPMPIPASQAALVEEFTVTVVESSPLFPAWETFDLETGEQLQVQSENPVDVFYGKAVGFRGPEADGSLQLVRYKLTFVQEVELAEVVMETAATGNTYMRLYDHQGREIVSKGPFGQGNIIHTETLVAPNPQGTEFFLEIENDMSHWFCIIRLSIQARTTTGLPAPGAVPADAWGQVVVPPGDPIHIGLVADFSGAVSWLGPVKENAVWMALDDQGPVKGFPVSVIVADGGCQGTTGTAAAQTMSSDPTIVGVIGHTCSSSCGPGAAVYEGAHLVMISPSCTGPDLSGLGYQVFNRVCIREDQGGDERNMQPVNTGVYQDFAHRYQSRYGQSLDSEGLGVYAAYAYDAAVILLRAIERVAVVDEAGNLVIGRQALASAVRATPGHQGVTGIISFDERGDRVP